MVLTGMLDGGTAGLAASKKCGGITVVQDPKDAAYPEMAQSALNNSKVDHCVPVAETDRLVEKLTHEPPGENKSIPKDIQTEAEDSYAQRAKETEVHIDRIREMVLATESAPKGWLRRNHSRPTGRVAFAISEKGFF